MLILFGEGVLFLVLHWYIDNVVNSNLGFPGNFFFFLFPSFWGINVKFSILNKSKPTLSQEELSKLDTDIKQEYEKAQNDTVAAAVRILRLEKYYGNPITGICWKNVHALRGLDLVIDEGQCFALLGHNVCVNRFFFCKH